MTDTLDKMEPNVNFREATCDVPSNLNHELIKKIAKQQNVKHQIKHAKTPYLGKMQAAGVRYAASRLDKVKPGWERMVNPWTIILLHEEHCVLGQIFGSYAEGLNAYCKSASVRPGGVFIFVGQGFIDRHFIKKAWRREIRARR